MRADRLISILMLLQARGRMTAAALAEELEVSERTIYRDVEALSASGVPVYAEHGPGGGLALLDSYRTNLTGLKEDEQRALFMMLTPFGAASGPLEKLGARQDLKSALLKLSAALPGSGAGVRHSEEETVRQRFYLDWSWWFHAQEPVPHLAVIQQAVWQDCRLRLNYRTYMRIPIQVTVEPYGLVAKAGVWYLVAGLEGGMRVYRISWLTDVEKLEERFMRPSGFDLASFWQEWCLAYEKNQLAFHVTLRISPDLLPVLPLYFGHRVQDRFAQSGAPDADGWQVITLPFESLEAARDRILDFGSAAEVLEPIALRRSILDYAEQIAQFYHQRG